MTARETVEAKAHRYLAEGRLVVTHVLGDQVAAVCMGKTGAWDLGHDPRRPGAWWCTCPARSECAHLVALQLVTVRRRSPGPRPPTPAQPDPSTRLDPAA